MALQQHNPNQGLPDVIRMQAQKGFYAHINGKLEVVNPGDVVDLPRQLACDMRAAGKAFMVDAELKRNKNYVPDYAKPAHAADPVTRQLAVLTDAITALTQLIGAGKGKASA